MSQLKIFIFKMIKIKNQKTWAANVSKAPFGYVLSVFIFDLKTLESGLNLWLPWPAVGLTQVSNHTEDLTWNFAPTKEIFRTHASRIRVQYFWHLKTDFILCCSILTKVTKMLFKDWRRIPCLPIETTFWFVAHLPVTC